MAQWKGHEVFLRAFKMLAGDPPVRGYVIGGALYETDGSQRDLDELRRLAESLGLSWPVGFTGFVDDAAAAMRALDVVVHASTQPEPFGLVIAEAMACGRAVVVSRGRRSRRNSHSRRGRAGTRRWARVRAGGANARAGARPGTAHGARSQGGAVGAAALRARAARG